MCFFYSENKAILAIEHNHSLDIVFQNKTFAMVFAMAGSNDIKRNQTYSRIETEHKQKSKHLPMFAFFIKK
jgi:hypothetical protein